MRIITILMLSFMNKKERYIECIVKEMVDMTFFDTQVSQFTIELPFSDGTKIEFVFTEEYVRRFVSKEFGYLTYPEIVMKYLSDYWGIEDRKLNREIFGKYYENLSSKLSLLEKHYIHLNKSEIKLQIKHIL